MPEPQSGIFAESTTHHLFLEFDVEAGTDLVALRTALAAATAGPADLAASESPERVLAFGAELWHRLAPDEIPTGLHSFATIEGPGGRAPATQRSLFLWFHGLRHDLNFAWALAAHNALRDVASLALEEHGFTYLDSRDLTGFVDGTANPKDDARHEAALVPGDGPGSGGSFVLTQRWAHDLTAFQSLPVTEQERIIGRTRPDSVELEGDAMPADSHVSRTDLKQDGQALKIYRRSAPFGTTTEHGLYFLAFACEAHRHETLLRSMFGATDDGVHDRLTEFSTATTGSLFFAPSARALADVLP